MIIQGDSLTVLKTLDNESVNCCVTSPPYWGLRDYGCKEQLGLENSPEEFVSKLVQVFKEVKRVLKNDGTLWLNLGDSYATNQKGDKCTDFSKSPKQNTNTGANNFTLNVEHGLKEKDLCGIPWRVAFALQLDGWYLRSDIIWSKPNPMPESVTDRPTKAHEYIFLLTKSSKYYYDSEAIKETREDLAQGSFDGKHGDKAFRAIRETRNKRSVWEIPPHQFSDAHFATFPPKLIEPCILAGCPRDGIVLDPFFGSGTTGLVAIQHHRNFIGIELNPEYIKIAEKRLRVSDTTPTMFDSKPS